jgi:hypothetical protein
VSEKGGKGGCRRKEEGRRKGGEQGRREQEVGRREGRVLNQREKSLPHQRAVVVLRAFHNWVSMSPTKTKKAILH